MILAAVTIKAAFQDGFLDLATKGAENYTIAQAEEENMMNELENFIKDKVADIEGGGNKAPRFIDGPKSVEEEKTNTQITIAMTAIDDDGDDLTYIIKYYLCNEDETKGDYIGEKKIEDVTQGEEQKVDITGLTKDTRYYFEVSASDNSELICYSNLNITTPIGGLERVNVSLHQLSSISCVSADCKNRVCPTGRNNL